MDEHVTVVAQVADARLHTFASAKAPRGKGQRLEVTITDGSGRLQLVFFGNGVHKPHKELLPGTAHCSRARSPSSTAASNWRIRRTSCCAATASRDGRHLGGRPHPALSRHRQAGVLEDRQGGPDRPAERPGGPRPAPGLPARGPRPGPPPRGPPQDPPPAHQGGHRGRPLPPQVGRGLRPPGRPGPPPPRGRPTARRGPQARPGRPAHRLRRPPSLHPHRGPAEGLQGDLRRPGHGAPDAPAAPGRGRLGQDDGGPARHARRRRRRRAGRDARAHRGARPAAPPVDHRDDGGAGRGRHARRGRAGHEGGAAHRVHGRRPPAGRRCWTWSPARPGSSSAPTR